MVHHAVSFITFFAASPTWLTAFGRVQLPLLVPFQFQVHPVQHTLGVVLTSAGMVPPGFAPDAPVRYFHVVWGLVNAPPFWFGFFPGCRAGCGLALVLTNVVLFFQGFFFQGFFFIIVGSTCGGRDGLGGVPLCPSGGGCAGLVRVPLCPNLPPRLVAAAQWSNKVGHEAGF